MRRSSRNNRDTACNTYSAWSMVQLPQDTPSGCVAVLTASNLTSPSVKVAPGAGPTGTSSVIPMGLPWLYKTSHVRCISSQMTTCELLVQLLVTFQRVQRDDRRTLFRSSIGQGVQWTRSSSLSHHSVVQTVQGALHRIHVAECKE